MASELTLMRCRPREGCGLHLLSSPIPSSPLFGTLPSPRGVRVASEKFAYQKKQDRVVAVPARGAGCISKRIQTRISTFVGSIQPAGSV